MIVTANSLAPDPVWELTRRYAADPRPSRLDLTLGVYRDDSLRAPVMDAVHAAERILLARRESKQYRGPSGHPDFTARMSTLLLGEELAERAIGVQTVAGTGALRLLAEFLAHFEPGRRVILGAPSYVNHAPVLRAAGLEIHSVPFVDESGLPWLEPTIDALRSARPGDAVLLQGNCHNPTGASLTSAMWDRLTDEIVRAGVVPFLDQAYYGLGDGLEEDLAGMRRLLARVPEAVISVSCSKAFSLYSERVGCALLLLDPSGAAGAMHTLEGIARTAYSQPPHHGAAIVATILQDEELEHSWRGELDRMRNRVTLLRDRLVTGALSAGAPAEFAALRDQRGLFLSLPLSPAAMHRLQREFGVYGLPSGRINLAGVPGVAVDALSAALAEVAAEDAARGALVRAVA
ncbi:aromatic amino acid transaminase [Rathayibacter sp. Leaf248]|uniref:aromatic amino acid transaminase n=1 Tax=Rathayibacter sp. Leaf248 TaxID=2876555 RepID=UPI001E42CE24|nr:aromatic amino acid transaminase [Rathayibacter sp. Leaf248]